MTDTELQHKSEHLKEQKINYVKSQYEILFDKIKNKQNNSIYLPKEIQSIIINYLNFEEIHTNNSLKLLINKCKQNKDYRCLTVPNFDTSCITSMHSLFIHCEDFNENINHWDVSNVTNMSCVFWDCHTFNKPLNKWNVSKATTMQCMFIECYEFNQALYKWKVKNVNDFSYMFSCCKNFNKSLKKWKIKQTADVDNMFCRCKQMKETNKPAISVS